MRRAALLLSGLLALGIPWMATPAAAATQVVMMQGYAYSPAALTVHVGDTVTWMQHDEAPHDVVTTSAPVAFRSPQLSQGQSWSYAFRQAGTYSYYCSVHPDMRATVTVLPAATTAPARPTTKPAAAVPPAKTTAPPKTTAAASSPGQPTTAAAATETSAPPTTTAVAQAAADTPPTLDPMLLVAGLVTGVAVVCLLLLGSRRA
jgi:plastocyanin